MKWNDTLDGKLCASFKGLGNVKNLKIAKVLWIFEVNIPAIVREQMDLEHIINTLADEQRTGIISKTIPRVHLPTQVMPYT